MAIDGVDKPAVLGRGTLRALCVACLAVIVYGTLGPVAGVGHAWIVPVEHWRWVPPQRHSDFNDLLTNFVVYIPVGIAFRLLVRRRGRAGGPDLLLGLGLSVALSYVTEVLQQALPARSSNLTDVYVNAAAAFVGCWIAVPFQRYVRDLHEVVFTRRYGAEQRWTALAWLATLGTVVLMTIPWRLGRPAAEWGFDEPLTLHDLRRSAVFAVVGLLATGAKMARGGSRSWAAVRAGFQVMLLAAGLEAVQVVLPAHTSSLRDALCATFAGGVGVLVAVLVVPTRATATPTAQPQPAAWPARTNRHTLARAGLVLLLAYVVATTLWGNGHFNGLRDNPEVRWLPFQAQFAAPIDVALTDLSEQGAVYATITFLCLLLRRDRGSGIALLLLLGVLGGCEVCRAFMIGHEADTTALLLAFLAWAVTVHAWQSVRPSRRSATGPDRATTAAAPMH